MSKRAEEAALKAYPEHSLLITPARTGARVFVDNFLREGFIAGYEQAEKDLIDLIESRISEIQGDAQPRPALRAELMELIDKIKEIDQ